MNGSGKQERATNRNQNLVWKLELGVHFLSSNNPVIDFIISWGSLVRILISWGSLVRALISWGSLMRALINWGSLTLQVTCLMKKQGHSHRCWWPFPSNKLYSSIIDGCIIHGKTFPYFKQVIFLYYWRLSYIQGKTSKPVLLRVRLSKSC